MDKPRLDVTVVVPVKDEEKTIADLHAGIAAALEGRSFEIIFIDDGSLDQSREIMRALREKDERVRVVGFQRNFGKAAALTAGFERARGKIVITMDADLQDDPAEIPRFLDAIERGAHLVTGWKKQRQDPWHKVLASKIFNLTVRGLAGVRLHDINCGFKAYRREVLDGLKIYGDLHRFIPALAAAKGYAVSEIEVKHHPRRFGESKYGLVRLPRGFLDLLTVLFLTQYMRRPLHLFGGAGLAIGGLGFIALLYLTILWFVPGHAPIGTRPLFIGGVMLLLLGAQLTGLGLMAEMFTHQSFRPADSYVVEEETED